MKPHSLTRWSYVLAAAVLLLMMALIPQQASHARSSSAEEEVQAAWQRAQRAGAYRFATEILQTTYPAPALVNVGRSSRQDRLRIEGEISLPDRTLLMTLWQDGGSALNARDGIEVRVEGDRAYGHAPGEPWQEIPDFSGAFAPDNDLLAYLAGVKNVRREETSAPSALTPGYTRYSFEVDGPAFASYLRDQMERYLVEKGELPPGLTLESSSLYRGVTGQGQIWVDNDGLPLRLSVHLTYPPEKNGERIEAQIQSDFSGFNRERLAVAPSPWERLAGALNLPRTLEYGRGAASPQRAAGQAGLFLAHLGLMAVLITQSRSKRVYAVLAVSLTWMMVFTPLLQSHRVAAFGEQQAARRAALEEQQAVREVEEALQASDWDPQRDPLLTPVIAAQTSDGGGLGNGIICTDQEKAADTDQDGLSDCQERRYGTQPNNPDTDGDGLLDGWEVLRLGTDPKDPDSDGDLIGDGLEVAGFLYRGKMWYSDPNDADTDKDGRPDSEECPERRTAEGVTPDPALACRDTDADGISDLFDPDSDNDGVPDKIDLSPLTILPSPGEGHFTRDNPFNLVVNHVSQRADQSGAYYPVFVDFQLRPVNGDHLAYALNVLDWPGGDQDGQIQRRSGNDSTLGSTLPPQERAADPRVDNGDLRLIPMLEIQMDGGNTIPLALTNPQTTIHLRGEDWVNPSTGYQPWISATIHLLQNGNDISLSFNLEGQTPVERIGIYRGTCMGGGDLAYHWENVSGGTATITNRNLVSLADGEHVIALEKAGHTAACASLGDLANAGTDKMIDPAPLSAYGITARDKDKAGTVLVYVPLNIVPDESGGGRVAFSARMPYQPRQANLGGVQQVRVVWLVQMLTDQCRPIPSAYTGEAGDWCNYDTSWLLDHTDIVHVYGEDWFLTGLSVREDHGLDVAIAWEDPAPTTPSPVPYGDSLWALANHLQDAFVSGRDQDQNGIRDLGVVTVADGGTVAETSIAGRFDSPVAPSVTITDRMGIPLTATLQVANFSYATQDEIARIMMTETVKILRDNFGLYTSLNPTLLFAREERYRIASLDMADFRTINGNTLALDLGSGDTKRPVETLAILSWAPYRYRDGAWQAYPMKEYWDLLEVNLKGRFKLDPALGDIAADVQQGQVLMAQALYLSLFLGRVGLVAMNGQPVYEYNPQETDTSLLDATLASFWLYGDYLQGRIQEVAEEAAEKFTEFLEFEALFVGMEGVTSCSKAEKFLVLLGEARSAVGEKASNFRTMFDKMAERADRLEAAESAIMLVGAVIGVTLTILYLTLKNETAALVIEIAARTITLAMAVYEAVKTIVKAVQRTLDEVTKATMAAGVVGLVIGVVVAFAAFIVAAAIGHVSVGSIAFNSALAGAIAYVIGSVIMFAIGLIPVAGQIIVAVITAIDALIYVICAAVPKDKLADTKAGQWFCQGISGLVSEAVKWFIYGATVMVDFEAQDRLAFSRFDHALVWPEKGMSVNNQLVYSVSLTNTINLVGIPIDWKAASYAWQYNDSNLKSSTFEYAWQSEAQDIHVDQEGHDLINLNGQDKTGYSWQSSTGTRPFYITPAAASDGVTLTQAGLNQSLSLYLAEGYAVPAQECFIVFNAANPLCYAPPTSYAPYVCLIPVCHVRTERGTHNINLGQYFVFDVFPATLDEFYQAVGKDGGYSLAWGQSGETTFARQRDFDGDGLLNPVDGGSDPDDSRWDTDGDGLSDLFEFQHGSDPTLFDSDADGLSDAEELRLDTDPRRRDSDGDGLTDKEEVDGWEFVYAFASNGTQLRTRVTSDPLTSDTDADGLNDFKEKVYGFNPRVWQEATVLGMEAGAWEVNAPGLLLRFEEPALSQSFADSSGYGNSAICTGKACPTAGVDGKYGTALQFLGDDWLSLGHSRVNALRNTLTVAAWIKPADLSGLHKIVATARTKSNNGFGFGTDGTNLRFTTFGVRDYTPGGIGLQPNQWYHVAAVMDSNNAVTFYLDGKNMGRVTHDAPANADTDDVLLIGATTLVGSADASEQFKGLIDEVVVFDRALTQQEIYMLMAAHYNPNDLFVRPGDTVYYTSTLSNRLYDRYAQGLFSLATTAPAVFSQINVLPRTFVFQPLQATTFSGNVQVSDNVNASQSVSLTQVADALITDWREQSNFAEMWLPLDEPGGATTFADQSGSLPPANGTCAGSACPTRQEAGYFDYAVEFNGNQFITLPDTDRLGLRDSSFSVSVWIKGSDFSGSGAEHDKSILGTDYDGVNNKVLHLVIRDGMPYMGFYGNDLNSNFALQPNVWYHVVFRYDKDLGEQSIYINGELKNKRTGAAAFQGEGTVYLGRSRGGYGFEGWIDDVRIFRRALTLDEIRALHSKPVMHLQFENKIDLYSSYFLDASGLGNHGVCIYGVSCPENTVGIQGQGAARFRGSDYLSVVPGPSLDMRDGQFTMAAWVYPENSGNSTFDDHVQGILGNYTGYGDTNVTSAGGEKSSYPSLMRVGRKLRFGFGTGSEWVSFTTANDVLTANAWNHVVLTFGPRYKTDGTFDQNRAMLYVNNQLVADWGLGNRFPTASPSQLWVGRASKQGQVYIDAFKVLNVADASPHCEIYLTWDGNKICTNTGTPQNENCIWENLGENSMVDVSLSKTFDNWATLQAWESDGGPSSDDPLCNAGSTDCTNSPYTFSTHQPSRPLWFDWQGDGSSLEDHTAIRLHVEYTNPTIPFRGKMDDLVIYKRALNADEVQELYFSASTALHLRLDDPPGSRSFENAVSVNRQSDAFCTGNTCPTAGVAGRINQAALFDGTSNVLNTGLILDQSDTSKGATMMAWVYPNSTSGDYHIVVSTDDGGWDWTLARHGRTWRVFNGDGSLDTGATVDVNRWQHIAAVFEPGVGTRFYKNGVLVKTDATIGYDTSTAPVAIGNKPGNNFNFDGAIDDVRIFNRALSTDDIQALYKLAPVFQMPLDEQPGATTFTDVAGGLTSTPCQVVRNCASVTFQDLVCHAQDDNDSYGDGGAGEFIIWLGDYRVWEGQNITARAEPYPINVTRQLCANVSGEVWEFDRTSAYQYDYDDLGAFTVDVTRPGVFSQRFQQAGDDVTLDWAVSDPYDWTTCPAADTAGQVGRAAEFDGVDDAISVPYTSTMDLPTFTVGAWVQPRDVITSHAQMLINKGRNYKLYISPGGMTVTLEAVLYYQDHGCPHESTRVNSTAPLLMNQWNHVVGTFDGKALKIYVNGYEQGSTTTTNTPAACTSSDSLEIGGGGSQAFHGRLDEITLYNRALTASEVRDLFLYQGKLVEERSSHSITIDKDAPISVLRSYTSTFPYMANKDTVMHVQAHDPTSGVELVEMSVNGVWGSPPNRLDVPPCLDAVGGSAWCPTFDPTRLGGEGVYTLQTRATDRVGIQETPTRTYTLYVDDTPPQVTAGWSGNVLGAALHPTRPNTWRVRLNGTVQDPTIRGSSGVAGSGVPSDGVWVTLQPAQSGPAGNTSQQAEVTGHIWSIDYALVGAMPTGRYTVTITARDRVGNESIADLGVVQVDATAPAADLNTWTVPTTTLTATLPLTGVVSELPALADTLLRLHLEEEAGSVIFRDSSGLNHHGSCVGSACPLAAVTGQYGRALRFDGTDDVVRISHSAINELQSGFSIAAWISPAQLSGTQYIVAAARTSSDNGFGFGLNGASLRFTSFGVGDYDLSGVSLQPNRWTHVAAVMDGENAVTFYVDGIARGTVTHTVSLNADTDDELLVGTTTAAGSSVTDGPFNGRIDELVVVGRALAADEVRALAQSQAVGVDGVQIAFRPDLPGSPFYNEKPLPSQILHVPLDDQPDENGVLSFRDISGHVPDGVCEGEACPTTNGQAGRAGSAAHFDGLQDYVRFSNSAANQVSSGFTVMAWMKAGQLSGFRPILATARTHSDNGFAFGTNDTGLRLWAFGSQQYDAPGVTLVPNVWYHVAAVVTGDGSLVFYVNGQYAPTVPYTSAALPDTDDDLLIGGMTEVGAASPSTFFAGLLDDVRVLNTALNEVQIRALYLSASDGLVLTLPFEESRLVDGSTVTDDSDWHHNGTLHTGDVTNKAVAGNVGAYALQFDGLDDSVSVPDSPALDLDTFSVGVWVFPTEVKSQLQPLIAKGSVGGKHNYGMFIQQNSDRVYLSLQDGGCSTSYTYVTAHGLNFNRWNYVMVTYDGARLKAYINGEAEALGDLSVRLCRNDLPITLGQVPGTLPFTGKLDDVRIYSRALSELEVKALYQSGWRAATVTPGVTGSNLATWNAQIPEGLEGAYALDLRGVDAAGHPDSSAQTRRVLNGEIDTLAPRVNLTRQTIGSNYLFTTIAQDWNLTEDGFSSPCGPGSVTTRDNYQSPWYLSASGQTSAREQRLYQLTAQCYVPIAASLGEIGAYDTPGQSYGVAISDTYALVADGPAGLQVIDVSDPTRPQLSGHLDMGTSASGVAMVTMPPPQATPYLWSTYRFARDGYGIGTDPLDIAINVPDAGTLQDIRVRLRLEPGTGSGQARVMLISPDGTQILLHQTDTRPTYGSGPTDCSRCNMVEFDDAATTPIGAGTSPFVGPFRPEQSLWSLNGHSTAGTWMVRFEGFFGSRLYCIALDILREPDMAQAPTPSSTVALMVDGIVTDRAHTPGKGAGLMAPCRLQDPAPPAQTDLPDLVIDSIVAQPASLDLNQPFVVTVTVRNAGTAAAGASTTGIHLDELPIPEQCLGWACVDTPPLGAGESVAITATHPGFARPGQHGIFVGVDELGLVAEANEDNNIAGPSIVTVPFFTVTATSPAGNGHMIARHGVISATFSQPVSITTVSTRTFTVYGRQTGVYTGTYAGGPVRFDAARDFKPGEELVANLSMALRSTYGEYLVPYAWQFRAAVTGGTGIFADSGQRLGNQTTTAVALGDVDGDGDVDVLTTGYPSNTLWLNSGGVWTDSHQDLGSGAHAVALGDLDGDGDLDAFVGYGGFYDDIPNRVLLNTGGVFTDSGQSLGNDKTLAVALGDLDGDGDLDALVGNDSHSKILLNNGAGVFSESPWLEEHFGQTTAVALGDLDGDGDLDAMIAIWAQDVQVWLNDGRGFLGDEPVQSLGIGAYALTLGDGDGDGDLDAVMAFSAGTGNQVWLNDGTGRFSDSGQRLYDRPTYAVALGDLDGDGDLDAFFGHGGEVGEPNTVWLNHGNGTFTDSNQRLGGGGTTVVGLGDLDGDGDLDAFVGNSEADTVWINNANAPLAHDDTFTVPEGSRNNQLDVLANDTDADGDALRIVAVGAPTSGTVSISSLYLFFTPTQYFSGTAVFTYTVSDPGGLTDTALVTVTVAGINDPPVARDDVDTTNEDIPKAMDVLSNDSDPDGQMPFLWAVTTPAHGSAAIIGSAVVYTPLADWSGTDGFTYTISDGTLTDTARVTVTVVPVNDAPQFTTGPDQTVLEDSGQHVVTGWATNIRPGPATATDEVGQALTFTLTNTNPALFSVQPQLDGSGTLTFSLAANAFGHAVVTATLHDDGGTANGGADTSLPQTFGITVTDINDPPTLAPIPDMTVSAGVPNQVILSGISAGPNETQPLTVTASSTNPVLIPQPTVIYASPNTNGALRFAATEGESGVARIVVTVTDGLSETVRSFQVTVSALPARTYALIADASRLLRVVDVTDPAHPQLTSTYNGNGVGLDVAALGQYAFVAAGYDGLRVLDISYNPPVEVAVYATLWPVRGITIAGTRAYLANDMAGLQVLDISNPTCPRFLGRYDTPGYAASVAVSGTLAYVADEGAGLRIIDVSNPITPTEIGAYLPPGGLANDVVLSGSLAYVVGYGLHVVDVSDPQHPQTVRSIITPPGFPYSNLSQGIAISGDRGYLAARTQGLRVVNLGGVAPSARACDRFGRCTTVAATPLQSTAQTAALALQATGQAGDPSAAIWNVPPVLVSTDAISITGQASAVSHTLRSLVVSVDSAIIYSDTWANGALTRTLWATSWTPSGEGAHALKATVTDWSGHTASDVFTVTLDTLPPEISITPTVLTSTHYHQPTMLDLTGLVTDTGGIQSVQVTVEQDGVSYPAIVQGNTWRLSWYLGQNPPPDGQAYTVTARVTDVAMRTAQVTGMVWADVVPPTPVVIAMSSNGRSIAPGDTVRTISPTLVAAWTASSDGSGLSDYLVDWITIITNTQHTLRNTQYPTRTSPFDPGDGQKVSVRVGSQDSYGQQRWQSWGPVYVDSPRTPDYVLLSDRDGIYRGWMDSGCTLVGVDRRVKQNAQEGSALSAGQKFYVTWNAEALRLAWTGANWNDDGDLFIYLDTQPGGATQVYNPYTATSSGIIHLPGVTPTSTANAMMADYAVWVQDSATAVLLRWDGGDWVSSTLLTADQYRFASDVNDGQTDLYLPFALLGITDPPHASLGLVAFATEPGALRLWATQPGANPVNSPRVIETDAYAGNAYEFALSQHYQWNGLGAGLCPNAQYKDADLRVKVSAMPAGNAYGFSGDNLFWLWRLLLGDKTPDVTSLMDWLSDNPPVGAGQRITYTLRYRNQGADTATGVYADVTAHDALRLSGGGNRMALPPHDIGPGEEYTATFSAVVDPGASTLPWASVEIAIYDATHTPSGPPLERLWVDHHVDRSVPQFMDIQQPAYVLRAGRNLLQGYVYDDSPVPTITLHLAGRSPLICPDATPQDGQWSCILDATGSSDGDTFQVSLQATDSFGQSNAPTSPQTFVVDTIPPTVTLDLTMSQVLPGGVVKGSAYPLFGQVLDNHGLGRVEACLEGSRCVPADVQLTGADTVHVYEDVPAPPITINNATTCAGGEIVRTFVVTDRFAIGEVSVGLDIEHTHRDDVRVDLESPSHTRVRLLSDDGLVGTHYRDYDVLLTDAAVSPYNARHDDDVLPPFYDREARPYESLRAFRGQPSAGVWTLYICDANPSADHGFYHRSRLTLKPQPEHTTPRSGDWSFTVRNTGDLDYVQQTVSIYGVDLAGNRTAEPLVVNVTVDNVPPVLTVTQWVSAAVFKPSVRVLSGLAHDGGQVAQIAVLVQTPERVYQELATWNGEAWQYDLQPASLGRYTLWVRAYDLAGNVTLAGPYAVDITPPHQVFLPVIMRNHTPAYRIFLPAVMHGHVFHHQTFLPLVMTHPDAAPDRVEERPGAADGNVTVWGNGFRFWQEGQGRSTRTHPAPP